jgi:hypothetical protein
LFLGGRGDVYLLACSWETVRPLRWHWILRSWLAVHFASARADLRASCGARVIIFHDRPLSAPLAPTSCSLVGRTPPSRLPRATHPLARELPTSYPACRPAVRRRSRAAPTPTTGLSTVSIWPEEFRHVHITAPLLTNLHSQGVSGWTMGESRAMAPPQPSPTSTRSVRLLPASRTAARPSAELAGADAQLSPTCAPPHPSRLTRRGSTAA